MDIEEEDCRLYCLDSNKDVDKENIAENEWVWPIMGNYHFKCCKCGLVHEMDFAVVDGDTGELLNGPKVVFRARRMKGQKEK